MKNFFTAGMPQLVLGNWQAWSIWLAIVLFPIFAAGAQAGASYAFAWLVIMGLLFGWKFLPELTKPEKQLFIGFAILVVVVALTVIFGNNLKEDLRGLDKYAALLWAFPAYLAIRRFVKEPGRPLIAGLLIAPIWTLMLGVGWDPSRIIPSLSLSMRLDGAYINSIILSNLTALFSILLLASVILVLRHPVARFIGTLMGLLGIVIVVATASRNGMFFLPVGITLMLFLLHRHLSKRHWVILTVIAVVLIGLFQLNPNNQAKQRASIAIETLVHGNNADHSTTSRLAMWQDSILIWKNHPILGVGPGSFRSTIDAMQASGETQTAYTYTHAHSIYFQAVATIGALGLLAILLFVFARPFLFAWSAWRHALTPWQSFYAVGIMLTVTAFMFFGLTEAWFSRNPMIRSYLICLLVFFAGMMQTRHQASSR